MQFAGMNRAESLEYGEPNGSLISASVLSGLERPAEHSDSGAIGRADLGKLPSAFRCRHMITVHDVQSLAPDVIHFYPRRRGPSCGGDNPKRWHDSCCLR